MGMSGLGGVGHWENRLAVDLVGSPAPREKKERERERDKVGYKSWRFTKCLKARIQTQKTRQRKHMSTEAALYLKADILKMCSVLFDDLLNEVGMSGLEIRSC